MSNDLRIVVPYTKIHPITAACLEKLAPKAERVFVGSDDLAYWRLYRDLWHDGESVLIIEQDIEFSKDALDQQIHCSCQWGASPYFYNWSWSHPPDSDGFSRFRSEVMAAFPAVPDEIEVEPVSRRHWHWVTQGINRGLLRRGYKRCSHCRVLHHHIFEKGCACGLSADHAVVVT